MTVQAYEFAGKALYCLEGIVRGTVVHYNDFEVGVTGGEGGFETLAECVAAVMVRNNDLNEMAH